MSEDHDKRIAELEKHLAEQKKINRIAELEAQIAAQKSGQVHKKSGFQRTTAKPMRQQSDEERRAGVERKIGELWSLCESGEITKQEYFDAAALLIAYSKNVEEQQKQSPSSGVSNAYSDEPTPYERSRQAGKTIKPSAVSNKKQNESSIGDGVTFALLALAVICATGYVVITVLSPSLDGKKTSTQTSKSSITKQNNASEDDYLPGCLDTAKRIDRACGGNQEFVLRKDYIACVRHSRTYRALGIVCRQQVEDLLVYPMLSDRVKKHYYREEW